MDLKSILKTLYISTFFLGNNVYAAASKQKPTVKKVAKEKIHITADVFEGYTSDNPDYSFKQFIGNVKAVNKNFTYRSDVVTSYDKKDIIVSEGNINVKGNKKNFEATAGKVTYNTKEKIAYVEDTVQGHQDKLSFFTEKLEYHSKKKQIIFNTLGTFKEEDMTVASMQGVINTRTKFVTLKQDVLVDTKDHELKCQKLTYNRNKEVINFDQDVKLTIKENHNYLTTPKEGTFYKKDKKILLKQGIFHSKKTLAYADNITINQAENLIQADENIEIINRNDDTLVAQHLIYNTKDKTGAFWGQPLIQKNNEDDTFYLIAERFEISQDSLPESTHDYNVFDDEENEKSEDNEEDNKKSPFLFKAIGDVCIYSSDFQGKSKDLYFDGKSSRAVFYGKPIFWLKETQITGQDVEMKMIKNEIDRLDIFRNAFMIIKDETGFYNQIKGKSMHVRFFENKLDDLLMKDNVESLLFVSNDGKFIGTNNIKCPKMTIDVNDDFNPEKINFLNQSSAVFLPKDQVDVSALTLSGFSWRIKEKPTLKMFESRLPEESNIPMDEEFIEDEDEIEDEDDNENDNDE